MLSVAVALFGAGLAAVAPATAQDKMAAVTGRQDLMKSNGQVVYRMIPGYIRSGQGTPEDVAKGAATIIENLKKAPAFFVPGVQWIVSMPMLRTMARIDPMPITDHVSTAYANFLERESQYQLYGTPRAGVLELIQQMDGSDEAPTSQEPFAGFTRLGKGAVAA